MENNSPNVVSFLTKKELSPTRPYQLKRDHKEELAYIMRSLNNNQALMDKHLSPQSIQFSVEDTPVALRKLLAEDSCYPFGIAINVLNQPKGYNLEYFLVFFIDTFENEEYFPAPDSDDPSSPGLHDIRLLESKVCAIAPQSHKGEFDVQRNALSIIYVDTPEEMEICEDHSIVAELVSTIAKDIKRLAIYDEMGI